MLELVIVSALVLLAIVCAVLIWQIHILKRRSPAGAADRLQTLAEGLLTLQRTLDARIEHSGQATNSVLVAGLTQLSTQLVSRIDTVRLESQLALEDRLQRVHRELQQQHEALRVSLQESLAGSRRDLFTMLSTLQQGVEQRLGENLAQHTTLFRDMTHQLGELSATNARIVEISQDINQLSRILESPKPRGTLGEFELERMLGNVLPRASYRMQAPIGEGLVDAAILLEGGWLCIDSKFPLDNFRRLAHPDCAPEEQPRWRKLFEGDLRRHITDIAHKYILPPLTLDFTLMFIPAENVYYELLLSEEVLAFARDKRVVPVSPNTLYAYLQAISIGFRGLKIAQETRRIEQLLLGLKKNFDEFKEHFRLIGKHLDRARGQFIQAETDVSRVDHAIGGIQFGTLDDQLPAPEDSSSPESDDNAERWD